VWTWAAATGRWPSRCGSSSRTAAVGVDSSQPCSPCQGYDETRLAEIAHWAPERPPAVIFSNAALQWLPHHEALFPHLVGGLVPGGVLAVQMPRQYHQPSHRLMRDLAEGMFPDRFQFGDWVAPVGPPAAYHRLLAPLGDLPDLGDGVSPAARARGRGASRAGLTEGTALAALLGADGRGRASGVPGGL
jgi:trans-aconitate 2-methyltransferase